MTIEVKVAHAETHFSELLSKVEAGEDVVISRGNEPIARLVRIDTREDRIAAIEAVKVERARHKPVSREEIRKWRDGGRR
ncbi:type II toxin-antitoxin system prevent-host-death family antitoxin [Pararhizobium sp. YC-54]|uniref:type II toxin-antitoxin system Phd/YefM family antitoxin n=1 Tax=Pararhizobium sp. YC-54 TaxID=2986920 RepID=UPI0021F7756C|nr:type II toxin-antitoxin system prevent-host-death family antitoxin [Pararhizobium sp. YC-54]MCV9997534.1 type II toxin-antitoxin system prevent-host-death family antitoxin [Pararhizobium sp. YC-54]